MSNVNPPSAARSIPAKPAPRRIACVTDSSCGASIARWRRTVNPDQWELYKTEQPSTAADEVVVSARPCTCSNGPPGSTPRSVARRSAGASAVGLLYGSANYDEAVFDRPNRFDILRSPNPHVGFGGGGVHFCPGSHLARLEINVMFNTIADHVPEIAPSGPQRRLRSGWLNGIKEMPVTYG